MAEQLILDLPARTALGREDFFVSPANARAVAAIEGYEGWPERKMVLVGPEGSGKTHLAHVWAEACGARVLTLEMLVGADPGALGPNVAIEDLDAIASPEQEEALFHLHNALAGQGGYLLLTGRADPAHWPVKLPDLQSRIMQAGLMRLEAPDDALLGAVMMKLAADRQLALTPAAVNFAVLRLERSFAAARWLIEALDARALRDKSRPTRAMVAELLSDYDG